MNHKVNDVDALHASAKKLHEDLVGQQSKSIIDDLDKAIEILRTNWKGPDAKININRVVAIRNGMTEFRNALDKLASASGDIAYNYREIQNSNLANKPVLAKIGSTIATTIGDYADPTIGVEVKAGLADVRSPLNSAKTKMEALISNFDSLKTEMLDNNFQEGPGREDAINAFKAFKDKFNSNYIPSFVNINRDVDQALKNYSV